MARRSSPVQVTGPLAVHGDGFRADLAERGYTPLSAANQLRLMAHLSRWLAAEGLSAGELTPARVEAFLAARRAAGYTCWLSLRGIAPLLGFLQSVGAAPVAAAGVVTTEVDRLLVDYRAYLIGERGLAASTVRNHHRVAVLFLEHRRRANAGLVLDELTAADVTAFVMAACADRSVGSAKAIVTGVRSLLRYLHLRGQVPAPLWTAVPAVAGWRGGSLPRALSADSVQGLLASCDLRRSVGRRDYAVLLLLARLGLRAAEVAALRLDDIDWAAGELLIRGKGRREERLPLPVDVGEAIVAYLRRGRSASTGRSVFLHARAPHGGISDGAVKALVRNACDRAGVPRVGAHRLRHTLATDLLGAGATLSEVGQVLRHRSLQTTAIYAKVDRTALRGLALPWPGGAT